MEILSGVYGIQSKIKPSKIYIGSAVNIHRRWNSHLSELSRNKHVNPKLQHHYNRYGVEDLVFSLILYCDKDSLLSTEQQFINIYNPWFNINKTAGSNLGYKWSIKAKQNLAIVRRKKNNLTHIMTNETKEKIRKSHLGKKKYQPREAIDKLILSNVDKKHTEVHNDNISKSIKEWWRLRKLSHNNATI